MLKDTEVHQPQTDYRRLAISDINEKKIENQEELKVKSFLM